MELVAEIQEQKQKQIPIQKQTGTETIDYKAISTPPGGLLIWIVILLEVFTFGLALVGLVYYRSQEPELFAKSSASLNTMLGGINTLVLLTSGFFMAAAVHYFKRQHIKGGINFMLATMVTGSAFLVIKWFEYAEKLKAGLGVEKNMFFTFYWLLTGFHFIHVIVGLVILGILLIQVKRIRSTANLPDIEAGAAFWHMCDLIWLLLFPALYLVF